MREEIITASVQHFALWELSEDERQLVLAAREATHRSHSPYSNYKVGAAVELFSGQIITGANQENASYGLVVCAERTTIFSAFNQGDHANIEKIAVTARPGAADEKTYTGVMGTPCGACRQVIKEAEDLAGQPMIILMDWYDDADIARIVGINTLLPFAFGPADLGISLKKK